MMFFDPGPLGIKYIGCLPLPCRFLPGARRTWPWPKTATTTSWYGHNNTNEYKTVTKHTHRTDPATIPAFVPTGSVQADLDLAFQLPIHRTMSDIHGFVGGGSAYDCRLLIVVN
jgi:hypothetical protein